MNSELFTDEPAPQAPADLFTDEPAPGTEPMTLAGFGKNVVSDIKGLGTSALEAGRMAVDPLNISGAIRARSMEPIKEAPFKNWEMLKSIPKGIEEEGKRVGIGELATGHPIEAAKKFGRALYEKPVTTGMEVAPVAGMAGKALGLGGKAAVAAEEAGAATRGAELAGTVGKTGKLAGVAEAGTEIPPPLGPAEQTAKFLNEKYAKKPISVETKSFIDSLDPKYKSALDAIETELEGKPKTKYLKQAGTGEYLPGVKAEHENIVNTYLNKPQAIAQPGQKPKAVFVFGLPATGKSSLIKKGFPGIEEYKNIANDHVLIDADEFMGKLKGYEPKKAPLFHDEAGDIAKQAIDKAMDKNMNMVIPAIGRTQETYQALFNNLRQQGYDIDMVHVDSIPKQAAFNATTRFVEGGRYVPPSYPIDEVGLKSKALYDKLKPEVNSYAEYRSEATRGQNPVLGEHVRSGADRGGRPIGGSNPRIGAEAGGGETPQPTTATAPAAPGVTPPPEVPAAPWAKTQEALSTLKSKIPPTVTGPAGEVSNFLSKKYGNVIKKTGVQKAAETTSKYAKDIGRDWTAKQLGAAPGQIRKLYKNIGVDATEELMDYAQEKGYVSPKTGSIGMWEKIVGDQADAGATVGGMRKLAAERGAAHNVPSLIEKIQAKLDKKYAKGMHSGEGSTYAKALEEIADVQPTPDAMANKISELFAESKNMDRLKQPSGAYADVARELRKANEELLAQYLNPKEVAYYKNALKDYGSTTQIKEFVLRKKSTEMGGRLPPGSGIIRRGFQKGLDVIGYKFGARLAKDFGEWIEKNPEAIAHPKEIFSHLVDEAVEAIDEIGNPLE
jgi:hypothetical protein